MKIVSIIPARGASKGIPKKNIKDLAGKPLIAWTIEQAKKSKYISNVYVSTENKEIASIASKYDVKIIKRPEELAKDDTPSLPVFQHFLHYLMKNEKYVPDIIVILQPTSPLRNVNDIDSCIEKLVTEKCDSVITVKKVEYPMQWMLKIDEKGRVKNLIEGTNITRRQDAEDLFIPNGAVFVTWSKIIIEKNTIRGPDTRAIVMPIERSIDIDEELDFFIAEQIVRKNERNYNCK